MSLGDHNRVGAVHTRKCELVDEVLRSFGTVRLQVTGCSMLPSVWPGDTLIIQRRDVREVAVGDILLYRRKARLIAHRVISEPDSLGKSTVGVRGDAFPGPDELLFRSEILGTVSRIVRGKKSILPPSRLKYHHRLIGILTWHSDLFARLLIFVHSICSAARWREASWKR
jgi:signal peptidase I